MRKARDNRKSEVWLFLRVRSHMATYRSNMATVAMLLRRCKPFRKQYLCSLRRVTGPHGHVCTLLRPFAGADRKMSILLLHKGAAGL